MTMIDVKIFDEKFLQLSRMTYDNDINKYYADVARVNYYKGVYVAACAIENGESTAEELKAQILEKLEKIP